MTRFGKPLTLTLQWQQMSKQHVLIVGGGFAGVKAALELCEDNHFEVTLISDRPIFRYYPTLYRSATGGARQQSSIPLQTIFKERDVKVVIAEAKTLDRVAKTLTTSNDQTFNYDIILLAMGTVTNYFGISGLKKYSYGIKSIEETQELKNHLHQQLTSQHEPDLNYVVIGGGPTGIELSGALVGYLRQIMKNHGITHRAIHVDLIEAAPKLLPSMPSKVSRVVRRRLRQLGVKLYLGQSVQGETADSLTVNGRAITSHTVIWTAGVTNHPFFSRNKFALTDRGKVVVDDYLQASPDVYVLGDNAATKYSGLAQTAIYDARFVAQNLRRLAQGRKTWGYRPKKPIYVIPVGPRYAVVLWNGIESHGILGWLLREAADFVAFKDIERFLPASRQWLTEFEDDESCPECATAAASGSKSR